MHAFLRGGTRDARGGADRAEVALTPFLCSLYLVRPQLLHRFVGYLEETAVHIYTNIVTTALTPGTRLHAAWKDVPAPEVWLEITGACPMTRAGSTA